MKTHTLFMAGLVFGMFTLAACEGGAVPAGQTPTGQTAVTPAGQEIVAPGARTVNTQAGTQEQEASALSEADMAAYNGALQLKDASFCDKIKDESYKNTCKTDIADQIALDEALKKVDASLCAKLSTVDKQDACKIKIEVMKSEEQARVEQQKETEKLNNLAKDVSLSGDITRCKEMGVESVARCEYFMLINQATQKNDPKICEQASDSATVEKCKKNFQENATTTVN